MRLIPAIYARKQANSRSDPRVLLQAFFVRSAPLAHVLALVLVQAASVSSTGKKGSVASPQFSASHSNAP